MLMKRLFDSRLWTWMFCAMIATLGSPAFGQQVVAEPAILASAESRSAWEYDFSPQDEALLEKIQRGCFQYFWKEVGSPAMLAKDKTTDTVCSIAAVGFQLSSLPIAVDASGLRARKANSGRP